MQSGLDAVPGRDCLAVGFVDKPVMQPDYITAAPLEPHQRGGVAMLRRMYLGSHDSVLADDPAMGMVATVLTFLQVRNRASPLGPVRCFCTNSAELVHCPCMSNTSSSNCFYIYCVWGAG